MHSLTRRAAAVLAVLGALAVAAPIADAGAATTPGLYAGLSAPAFLGPPVPAFGFTFPWLGGMTFSRGPTVINSIFNGATVVQVANGAAFSSVIASP